MFYFVSHIKKKILMSIELDRETMEINDHQHSVTLLSLYVLTVDVDGDPTALKKSQFARCTVLHVGTFPNNLDSFFFSLLAGRRVCARV